MAQLNIPIPDAQIERVETAFAEARGYPAEVDDGAGNMVPNPQTKRQFMREQVRLYVRQVVVAHEASTAGERERERVRQRAEQELGI